MGRFGRRLAAISIDWAIAAVLSAAFFDYHPLVTLGIFVAMQIVMTVVVNASIGHALVGLRVVPMEGGLLGVIRPIIRAALIALVIPALVWDDNNRGLHDRASRTILLRR